MKCCLCSKEIEKKPGWDQGNNAEPLAAGRCCDTCNNTRVIPARLAPRRMSINDWMEELKSQFDADDWPCVVDKAQIKIQLLNEKTGEVHLHEFDYQRKGALNLRVTP